MTPETLKRIEWAGYVDDTFDNGTLPVCPCCRALQHYGKHKPGCELKADLDASSALAPSPETVSVSQDASSGERPEIQR